MFCKQLARGAAAGATGVTALNIVTYLDIAARARASSDTPARSVELLARKEGVGIPGQSEARTRRLEGLGALAGISTGVAIGVAGTLLQPTLRRLPATLAGAVLVQLRGRDSAGTPPPPAGMQPAS